MKAKLIRFGEIEIAKHRYAYDVVIEQGRVSKRKKGPSRPYRDQYGHTPLAVDEAIPWGGKQLIIGTGVYGKLPVMPEVYEEAERRGVEIVALPTKEACQLLRDLDAEEINAILHITC